MNPAERTHAVSAPSSLEGWSRAIATRANQGGGEVDLGPLPAPSGVSTLDLDAFFRAHGPGVEWQVPGSGREGLGPIVVRVPAATAVPCVSVDGSTHGWSSAPARLASGEHTALMVAGDDIDVRNAIVRGVELSGLTAAAANHEATRDGLRELVASAALVVVNGDAAGEGDIRLGAFVSGLASELGKPVFRCTRRAGDSARWEPRTLHYASFAQLETLLKYHASGAGAGDEQAVAGRGGQPRARVEEKAGAARKLVRQWRPAVAGVGLSVAVACIGAASCAAAYASPRGGASPAEPGRSAPHRAGDQRGAQRQAAAPTCRELGALDDGLLDVMVQPAGVAERGSRARKEPLRSTLARVQGGKAVVLSWASTTCGPCVEEAPEL